MPKDHNTFRRVAWFALLDAVKYTSLSFIFADKIEAARIEKSLGIVHSHRIMPTLDCLFDRHFGYSSFRQASKDKSLQYINGYKIVTDISNFFDRVSLHAIEGMLVSIDCDKEDVDFLHRVMIHFAGRSSFGLPVGGDASRILSEAVLINVDKRLREDGVDFIRYVDDYRIFATSRSRAYAAVLALTSYLYEEGLFINYAKTHIEKITVSDTEPEREEKTIPQEHKSIDENEQVVAYRSSRSGVSGRSRISKYYKKPGIEAIDRLKEVDIEDLLRNIENSAEIDQEQMIRDAVKYFLYLSKNPQIIMRLIRIRITSIVYVSDALVKDGDRLSIEERKETVQCIADEMDLEHCPYPYLIPFFRIISSKYFLQKDTLVDFIKEVRMRDNTIFFRELILLTSEHIPRPLLRSMCRENFSAWPYETQRALMHVVKNNKGLADAERAALIKDMQHSSSDYMLDHI